MLLVVFLGLPDAFLRGEQVTVDVIDHLVSPRVLAVLKAIGAVLSTLFLALLVINLIQPLMDAYRFGDTKADLPVPLYPLVALVLVCLVASFIAMLLLTVREMIKAGAAMKSGTSWWNGKARTRSMSRRLPRSCSMTIASSIAGAVEP